MSLQVARMLGKWKLVVMALALLTALAVGYGALYREACEDPRAPHCSREGGGNHKPCGKCEMDCNGEGRKPEDRRCSTFCCEEKCDCSPPCS
jgi:hypothetical protein